jgi:FtsH-binding integral membrane protein
MLMGGRTLELGPDEFVFASINIYLDIINIFLNILSVSAQGS